MDFSTLNSTSSASSSGLPSSSTQTKNAAETQDRFLKLLVAQMQHQDPLNPMDNAQVTSQMAQIQQVTSLATVDASIKGLGNQFSQMQALQSVSLVGHDVLVEGNHLNVQEGVGRGSFALDGPASKVQLEVLTPAGTIVDTVQLGAQGTGLQNFTWPADKAPPGTDLKFRITAAQGTTSVASSLFARDRVDAVSNAGGKLTLQLAHLGMTDYASVLSVD
jgi:flagellar basal-body rod modification protein FlgD